MHRSQLAGFIIDCETDDLDAAANFWGQALGCNLSRSDDPEDDAYVELETDPNEVHVEVQRVPHPSRLHLDIETDDIEAEVLRLEQLGAKRVAQVKQWWVMEAPTGHRFCVVRPQRANFSETSNEWS
jgi:predicted enzyme related to lactoylglutathione lyase